MSKYPELANRNEWTPRMIFIHRRAMLTGLISGGLMGLMLGVVLGVIL